MPENRRPLEKIPENHVLVKIFALQSDRSAADFSEFLDEAEMARALSFASPEGQSRFASCRSSVKRILAQLTDEEPARIHFHTARHGKPYIQAPYFNYANTKTHGAIAVCRNADIGLDLEDMTRRCNIRRLAGLFNPAERLQLEAIRDEAALRRAFFTLWVRKEAVMKADGRGLSLGVGNIRADSRPEFDLATYRSADGSETLRWRVPVCLIGRFAIAVALPEESANCAVDFPDGL